MKRNVVFMAAFLLLSVASVTALGQTRPTTAGPVSTRPVVPQPTARTNAPVPDTKIAIVDTTVFGDEKLGITRFVNAQKTVQREFEPKMNELVNLQNRLKVLADEITKLSGNSVVSPQSIQAKREEGERLERELKYKKELADADFEKRYREFVRPISSDIGKAMDLYATQNGLTMILDISKLAPAVITVNPAMDITQTFIADYNRKNP